MKKIKQGKIPYYKYILRCKNCETIFESKEKIKISNDCCQIGFVEIYYKCPVCKKRVYEDETIITIKYYKED